MSEFEKNIGNFIIAGDLGIGEIVEVTDMKDMIFYKVLFTKNDSSNFFSATNTSNYRMLSDKETVLAAIETFKNNKEQKVFENTQQKINFYKKELKSADVLELSIYLNNLNNESEVHPSINKIFKGAVKNFIQEIQHVLMISNAEAWKLLELNKSNY